MLARNVVVLSTGLLLCLATAHGATVDTAPYPTTGTYQNLLNTDAAAGSTMAQVSAQYRAGIVRPRI
ncbi:MAG TPA: hypothetical protein VH640_14635 [Bryobacteraceae bacterium]|jgi:hypothetical protein